VLLTLLGAAAKQNNQPLTIFSEINPVARTKIYPQLEHTGTNTFNIRDIAQSEPGKSSGHFSCDLRVQSVKPILI
jgi:hypothetical protein